LSQAEKSAGWQILFDGKSMNGWESHNGGDWKIENGAKLPDTKDAKHAAGVIGFQCQKDNHIEFRNIKLLSKK